MNLQLQEHIEVLVHTQDQEGEGRCCALILGADSFKLLPPKQAFLCPPTRQRHQEGKRQENVITSKSRLIPSRSGGLRNIEKNHRHHQVYTKHVLLIDL